MGFYNDFVISEIIVAVEAYHKNEELEANKESGIKYILGQVIRQYEVAESNCHYTKAFKELWDKLTDKEISGSYTERYVYVGNEDILVKCYSGNKHEYTEEVLSRGDKFTWNDIFHYEHTTTVTSIVDKLIALEDVNYDSVEAVLETMHVTRMTKEENVSLHNGSKRDVEFESVVKNLYNAKGVYLVK